MTREKLIKRGKVYFTNGILLTGLFGLLGCILYLSIQIAELLK